MEQQHEQTQTKPNWILTLVITNLLITALILFVQPNITASAVAGGPRGGVPNAADQRLEMIRELRDLNAALRDLESQMQSELKVEVTSMPRVRLDGDGSQ